MSAMVWSWPKVACALMWRLAPRGTKVTRKDLGGLPMDRVLVYDTHGEEIAFSWISLRTMRRRVAAGEVSGRVDDKVGVLELQGRWMKLVSVLLWKLAKDGLTLTAKDFEAVPADQQLLAQGTADAIVYRFLPHAEARAIAQRDSENEGRIIVETGQ